MGKKKKKKNQAQKEFEKILTSVLENESVMSKVFGKYSDGTTRSMYDAIHGEFLSPKQKEDIRKKKKKEKKKKKKAKKDLMNMFK